MATTKTYTLVNGQPADATQVNKNFDDLLAGINAGVSATNKVLGRATAGAGPVEEIPCTAAGRALIDDANAAAQIATLGLDADIATLALPANTTISAAGAELMNDASAAAQLITLGVTSTAAELNALDGITPTVTELNFVDGVTSAIQTQFTGKAATTHTHTKSQITDMPTTLPASDVYAWAKASVKPTYTAAEVGTKKVSTGTLTLTGAMTYVSHLLGVFPTFVLATGGVNGTSLMPVELTDIDTLGISGTSGQVVKWIAIA